MREITQGDTDRLTRAYFDSMLLEMRHIDGKKPDTSFTLYAENADHGDSIVSSGKYP